MKEKILALLAAKFVGVSDAILRRIADKLAKTSTTDEQAQQAVDATTFQQVLESYGDSRATEAQQTAVTNYEKKHNLKDGKPIEGGNPAPEGNPAEPDQPEWVKQLIESNKKLTERLDAMESDKITTSRRAQLNEIVSKLPETLRKAYERTPVDNLSNEEFDTLKETINTEVTGILKESQTKGAVFGKPFQGGASGEKATEDEVKSVVDKIRV